MLKQVVDRKRSSRRVAGALGKNKHAIVAALHALLSPAAARLGKPVPKLDVLVELLAETLRERTETLVETSDAHEQEGLDDAEPRRVRDTLETDARAQISGLRKVVEGLYGDAGLRALGFGEPLPPTPDQLAAYGTTVANALARKDLVLVPLRKSKAATFDAAIVATELKEVLGPLEAALGVVSNEANELDGTKVRKDQAMAAHNVAFTRITAIVEQMARLAGLNELADRLRPSASEPGVLVGVGEEDDAEDTDAAPTPARAAGGGASDAEPKPRIPIGYPGAEPFEEEEEADK